jgi:hypothetical protein
MEETSRFIDPGLIGEKASRDYDWLFSFQIDGQKRFHPPFLQSRNVPLTPRIPL